MSSLRAQGEIWLSNILPQKRRWSMVDCYLMCD